MVDFSRTPRNDSVSQYRQQRSRQLQEDRERIARAHKVARDVAEQENDEVFEQTKAVAKEAGMSEKEADVLAEAVIDNDVSDSVEPLIATPRFDAAFKNINAAGLASRSSSDREARAREKVEKIADVVNKKEPKGSVKGLTPVSWPADITADKDGGNNGKSADRDNDRDAYDDGLSH